MKNKTLFNSLFFTFSLLGSFFVLDKPVKAEESPVCQDASTISTRTKFDVILIDAPCSSTGTIRKNPDILLRTHQNDINNIIETQKKILSNASKLLKKNGLLMYVVCSLEKAEGEKCNRCWKYSLSCENFAGKKVCPRCSSILADRKS